MYEPNHELVAAKPVIVWNGELFCVAFEGDQSVLEGVHFVYVLFKDQAKVDEVRWTPEKSHRFSYHGDGIYYAQVEMRKIGERASIIKRTRTVGVFTDSYRGELDKYADGFDEYVPSISFRARPLPYSDFVLIVSHKNVDSDFKVDGFNVYRFQIGTRAARLCTSDVLGAHGSVSFLLSGCAVVDADGPVYVRGTAGLVAEGIEPAKLEDTIGTFTLLRYDQNKITVSSDYHSSSKIYYFDDGDSVIVSNRYHLLLLAAAQLVKRPVIYEDKAVALLSTAYHELFSHNFSRRLLLDKAFQLYLGERLVISDGGIRIEHTEIHSRITGSQPPLKDDKEYVRLLERSAFEILRNCRAIVGSDAYDHIVVDLSGGLDSRIVFAAVTNIDDRGKVAIRTKESKFPLDHIVANFIVSMFDYPWYDGGGSLAIGPKNLDIALSFVMEGKYFSPPVHAVSSPRAIVFNGFHGETQTRPRGAKSFLFGSYLELLTTPEAYFHDFFLFHGPRALIVDHEEHGGALYRVLRSEFMETPGETIAEKLETTYLNYSHSYHGSESVHPSLIVDAFSPMKSKALFELGRRFGLRARDNRLAFDMVYMLNPKVSVVEYENKQYNSNYIEVRRDLLVSREGGIEDIQVDRDVCLERWRAAQDKLTREVKKLEEVGQVYDELERCIGLVKFCVRARPDLFGSMKYPLLHFLRRAQGTFIELNTLKNKLMVVADHLRLLGDDDAPASISRTPG